MTTLREKFMQQMLLKGYSQRTIRTPVIQQMLGHKSLKTTSGYLHVQQYTIQGVKSPVDSLTV